MIYVHVLGAQSRIKEVKRYLKKCWFSFSVHFSDKTWSNSSLILDSKKPKCLLWSKCAELDTLRLHFLALLERFSGDTAISFSQAQLGPSWAASRRGRGRRVRWEEERKGVERDERWDGESPTVKMERRKRGDSEGKNKPKASTGKEFVYL